ncbi:MAG: metal ABC transporter permease [Nanoarchaeota archaeon]|nr:metal ABC transporter permease [Nanoarchaeota archaeon]MBU4452006.1 metal ABC transporter permease [Nanoarchaeota archaeon]MCG2724230.1 metal ABC transporter permease [archaeon]
MIEILSYTFMQKAFISGIVIAIACSLLGMFLVLRKFSLIGDGIAHISFGGVATGLLFNVTPFIGALLFGLIGSFGILKLKEKSHLHGDTAIGIVSHVSLGIGIFIASIANGFNVDIMSYLFGSILSIKTAELVLSVFLSLTVIIFILIYYKDLFYISFDEESAKVSGININFLNSMLIILTAVTIVCSMNVVGLMLASSLIILPSASALQVKASFKRILFYAVIISVFSVVSGLVIAYYYDFAVSGTIVLINAFVFLSLLVYNKAQAYGDVA